jgi:hypothetical protein
VAIADEMAKHPSGSLPEKLSGPGELDGLYHLMKTKTVTHQALLDAHVAYTMERITQRNGQKTLIIHDTTELDYSTHRKLQELGQIGNGNRRGYLCHNSLAVAAESREVLGLTNQILHHRPRVRKGETHAQRRLRTNRESLLWLSGVRGLPNARDFVDVCDRGADTFEFLEQEIRSGRTFVIRSNQDRAIYCHEQAISHLMLRDYVVQMPSLTSRIVHVPAATLIKKPKKTGKKTEVKRPTRDAEMQVAAGVVWLRPPTKKHGCHGNERLPLGVIRIWEPNPPAGQEPLEWVLFTNHEIRQADDALQVIEWYQCRWIIEEFHKAMKTGCGVENPQFQYVDRLEPVIILLSVVALSLLNLRELARRPDAKDRPARQVISEEYIEIVSLWRHKEARPDWTIHDFCMGLARLGGHLNRKYDGLPGWLTLWRGWRQMIPMVQGARAFKRQKNVPKSKPYPLPHEARGRGNYSWIYAVQNP